MAQQGQAAGPGGADPAAALKMMQSNPEMMKQASEQFKSMSDEDLAKMPGMPAGVTPEMARMAGEMMSNMSPEDMQNLQKMQQSVGGAGGLQSNGGAPPTPDTAAMEKMMSDPAMVETMSKMMSNMSPEMAQQMGMSPEQAKQASEAMGKMDPATLQAMMKWSLKAKGAWETVKTKRFWMQALLVLFLAMLAGHITGTF